LSDAETAAAIPHYEGVYNKVVYLSTLGDGTDGKTWDTAFTTFSDAYDACLDSDGNNTAILVLPGSYDLNYSGVFEIAKPIDIIGSHRGEVKIINTHTNATAVFKVTAQVGIHNVRICCDVGIADGLIISGMGAMSTHLEHCKFSGMNVTGASTLLTLEDGVPGVELYDCNMRGHTTHTTAIKTNDAKRAFFDGVRILGAGIGVNITHASDNDLYFTNMILDECAVGLDIDNGTHLHFNNITFHENTTNIAVAAAAHGETNFVGIHTDDLNSSVVPADLTGTAVATGVGVNTWGTLVTLRAAVAATKPYYIVGLVVEFSTKEKYGVRLTNDAGSTYLWDGVIESGAANEAYRVVFTEPHLVYTGATLQAQSKSEGGSDTANIWVKIQEI
jgi:hypothetical protein